VTEYASNPAPKPKSQRNDRKPRTRLPAGPPSTVITNGDPIPPPPREEPTPEAEEKVIARGTLMALLVQEIGSYLAVAELFNVTPATVRHWVHETRKRSAADVQRIADRLQHDVAHLAVDRVVEGLKEGETMFAADLGRRVLHGLGALRNHTSLKTDGPTAVTTLTLNINAPPTLQLASARGNDIVDGSVLGKPRELATEVADSPAADDG
jgi:predicted transcriptional regulator